jgi:hypothetical protein
MFRGLLSNYCVSIPRVVYMRLEKVSNVETCFCCYENRYYCYSQYFITRQVRIKLKNTKVEQQKK